MMKDFEHLRSKSVPNLINYKIILFNSGQKSHLSEINLGNRELMVEIFFLRGAGIASKKNYKS